MNLQRNGEIEDSCSEAAAGDRASWAGRIAGAWRGALDGIFETGRLLIAAKAALDHGEFMLMTKAELPFSHNTANQLMAIAKNPALSNSAYMQNLPPAWGTLYELTKIKDPEVLEAAIAGGRIHPNMERKDAMLLRTAERRGERLAKIETLAARSRPLPDVANAVRTWSVIYADPPWAHRTWSEAGKQKSPEQHYPTMSHDALCAMPVIELAAPRSALFMWTTGGHLAEAIELMGRWGFTYKSHLIWLKTYPSGQPRRRLRRPPPPAASSQHAR